MDWRSNIDYDVGFIRKLKSAKVGNFYIITIVVVVVVIVVVVDVSWIGQLRLNFTIKCKS